ncbi:uncharacterized protein [Notamacropus eugenii]|uniref:uncharacterized protein n=1 Tax=Notamacropus eugenii TaxID=9315 RepID=UPI003B67F6EC
MEWDIKLAFLCSICGQGFQRHASFQHHLGLHAEEKPLHGVEYGKSFLQGTSNHQQQQPPIEQKPHICGECSKDFQRNEHLVTHQQIYTGEQPFSCQDCGRAFSQSSQLASHRCVHTSEKPYACSECGELFSQSAHLARHQHIHTGENLTPVTHVAIASATAATWYSTFRPIQERGPTTAKPVEGASARMPTFSVTLGPIQQLILQKQAKALKTWRAQSRRLLSSVNSVERASARVVTCLGIKSST